MNPPEDPNDRLLDSLLRESVRGGADLPLLEGIAGKLDRTPVPAKRRRSPLSPWLSIAAVLMVAGVLGVLWHQSGRHGREEPMSGASPRTKTSEEPGPRIRAFPVPAITKPRAESGRESSTPHGPVERQGTVSVGKGIRLRVMAFPADPALEEVYLHDPEAPDGTPGTRIEVRPYLAPEGGVMPLRGKRVMLGDRRDRLVEPSGIFGELQIPRDASDGFLLILPGSGKPGEPARRILFLDASPRLLPPGSVMVVNLSPALVSLKLEHEIHQFPSGESKVIGVLPIGRNGSTEMQAYFQHHGEWRRMATGIWPPFGPGRMLQVLWLDPASGSILMKGFRDASPAVEDGGEEPITESLEDPVDGLVFLKQEATMWYVQFGLESQGKWAPRFVGLTPDKKKIQYRVSAADMLEPGDTFFHDGPMAGRFKFLGIEEQEIKSARTGLVQRVKIAIYEDLSPARLGTRYRSQAGLPDAELENHAYHDRTAVFKFGGVEFRVEQHAKFTLPGEDERLEYVLKEVSEDRVVIETEGVTREIRR